MRGRARLDRRPRGAARGLRARLRPGLAGTIPAQEKQSLYDSLRGKIRYIEIQFDNLLDGMAHGSSDFLHTRYKTLQSTLEDIEKEWIEQSGSMEEMQNLVSLLTACNEKSAQARRLLGDSPKNQD